MVNQEVFKKISLFQFDQSHWRKFDKNAWDAQLPKIRDHIRKSWGKVPEVTELDSIFIEEKSQNGISYEAVETMVSATGNPTDDFIQLHLLIPSENAIQKNSLILVPIINENYDAKRLAEFLLNPQNSLFSSLNSDQLTFLSLLKSFLQNGYGLMFFDILGSGSRQFNYDLSYLQSRLLLFGMTLNGKVCFDIARIMDYLALHPKVNPNSISICSIGISGALGVWASIYDSRFFSTIVINGIGHLIEDKYFSGYISAGDPYSSYFILPNLLDPIFNLDFHEVMGLLSPRNLHLISFSSTRDDLNGTVDIIQWLEQVYNLDEKIENSGCLEYSLFLIDQDIDISSLSASLFNQIDRSLCS